MTSIEEVKSYQILDSRGNPTLYTVVKAGEYTGSASVPSGASTGEHECVELRDEEEAYHGLSVNKAVENVNTEINKELQGVSVFEQERIDERMIELDGTSDKSRLGANSILSVSLASARCGARAKGVELHEYLGGNKNFPTPLMNVINGGEHAGNDLRIQELLIIPRGSSFREKMRIGTEVYHELKEVIREEYGGKAVNVGDEGGFAPPIETVREGFDLILEAVKRLGYGKKVKLGIDAAASEFYKDGGYELNGERFSKSELLEYYKELVKSYPLVSIEDPFNEDDFETTSELTKEVGSSVQIVGDDLLVTSEERLREAIKLNACNALLLKVNQVGTLTEARRACELAQSNDLKVVVSHRSGETCDSFISDLCLGWNCSQLKAGAPARGERVSKYNRLLILEDGLI